MASPAERSRLDFQRHVAGLLHTTAAAVASFFSPSETSSSCHFSSSRICVPLKLAESPGPFNGAFSTTQPESKSTVRSVSSPESGVGFPSTVRIAGLSSDGRRGGPAFVGQVFSMCDLTGTGLMAVSTHFDIPFISKRTPQWLKKVFANITNSQGNGPVFRFFLDLGDAVSYVKKLNIRSGVVGACRLDLAYEHFKDKPHMFQFVPNEKQVKAANKLLKTIQQNGGKRKVEGVPVFGAQNLDIAVATADGIRWYTPYFFDKNMLDSVLEESVDQHFQALIQSRHMQRRRDVVDDSLAAEVIEEMEDSIWEPPEVQEALDEIGNPGIPLSVISKAAEIQLLSAVDRVLLGNRWLRKATGIQPKFPYIVDSFERRSASSLLRASMSKSCLSNSGNDAGASQLEQQDKAKKGENRHRFQFPFGGWFSNQWSKKELEHRNQAWDIRSKDELADSVSQSPHPSSLFLPKITMVGISTGEAGQMSKASLKKTMEDLTRELEQTDRENIPGTENNEAGVQERDPLFVANVGDYYPGLARTGSARTGSARTGSARWVRGGNN